MSIPESWAFCPKKLSVVGGLQPSSQPQQPLRLWRYKQTLNKDFFPKSSLHLISFSTINGIPPFQALPVSLRDLSWKSKYVFNTFPCIWIIVWLQYFALEEIINGKILIKERLYIPISKINLLIRNKAGKNSDYHGVLITECSSVIIISYDSKLLRLLEFVRNNSY